MTAANLPGRGPVRARRFQFLLLFQAAKLAKAVAEVLDDRFNDVRGADVATFLFHLVEPSELDPRPAPRFFRSHARAHKIGNPMLQVESKLSVEVFFSERSSEKPLAPAQGFTSYQIAGRLFCMSFRGAEESRGAIIFNAGFLSEFTLSLRAGFLSRFAGSE